MRCLCVCFGLRDRSKVLQSAFCKSFENRCPICFLQLTYSMKTVRSTVHLSVSLSVLLRTQEQQQQQRQQQIQQQQRRQVNRWQVDYLTNIVVVSYLAEGEWKWPPPHLPCTYHTQQQQQQRQQTEASHCWYAAVYVAVVVMLLLLFMLLLLLLYEINKDDTRWFNGSSALSSAQPRVKLLKKSSKNCKRVVPSYRIA